MKFLVTGATGFIGYYVIRELLAEGYKVVASAPNHGKARLADWYPEVSFVSHTIGNETEGEDLFEKFGRPDVLIHLAWPGLPDYQLPLHVSLYEHQQYTFLQTLLRQGLKSLSVAGTCFEYGLREGRLSEDMEPDPHVEYGIAKNDLRRRLMQFADDGQFDLKWVRLFYMFGHGQNGRSLFAQLEKALQAGDPVFNMSGGQQERDYLSVESVARYLVAISVQREVTGIINCCSGQPRTIEFLVREFIAGTGKSIALNLGHYPYNTYEPMRFWGDTTRLDLALGR